MTPFFKSKRLIGTIGIVTAALILGLSTTSTAASSTNFVANSGATGCSGVNMADNATNTWFPLNLEARGTSAVNWGVAYIGNETPIVEQKQTSQTSNTDVTYLDSAYRTYCDFDWYDPSKPSGTIGLYSCKSTTANAKCQSSEVRFSTDYFDAHSAGWNQDLVLHESGHQLGLSHRDGVSGEVMQSNLTTPYDYYSAHDKALLNANY